MLQLICGATCLVGCIASAQTQQGRPVQTTIERKTDSLDTASEDYVLNTRSEYSDSGNDAQPVHTISYNVDENNPQEDLTAQQRRRLANLHRRFNFAKFDESIPNNTKVSEIDQHAKHRKPEENLEVNQGPAKQTSVDQNIVNQIRLNHQHINESRNDQLNTNKYLTNQNNRVNQDSINKGQLHSDQVNNDPVDQRSGNQNEQGKQSSEQQHASLRNRFHPKTNEPSVFEEPLAEESSDATVTRRHRYRQEYRRTSSTTEAPVIDYQDNNSGFALKI